MKRTYMPTDKHRPGGWGTEMDLDDETAQEVLQEAIEVTDKKQLIGVYNGKIYAFQPDNRGGYHGYPISGEEFMEKYASVARIVAQKLGVGVKRIRKEVEI